MLILRLEIFVHLFTNYFSDQHNGVTCDCCKTTPIFGKITKKKDYIFFGPGLAEREFETLTLSNIS